MKDLPFSATSIVNTHYSWRFNFWCDQNHSFFRELLIQRDFTSISAFSHLLCSNIFTFRKDLASNHPVCREIAHDRCASNYEFSEYLRSLGLVERTCYFIL